MSTDQYQPSESYSLPPEVLEGLKKIGLTVPVWDRALTHEDIQYFLDRWLFVQIVSSNLLDPYPEVKRVRAKTCWTILNYGDAMSTSPGAFLWGGGDFRIGSKRKKSSDQDGEDDNGGGDLVNPDKGTVWRQAFETAAEMVALAQALGWKGVHVVDGHALMKWAVWMHATDAQLHVSGFEPSQRDVERRERIKRSEIEDIKRFQVRF